MMTSAPPFKGTALIRCGNLVPGHSDDFQNWMLHNSIS